MLRIVFIPTPGMEVFRGTDLNLSKMGQEAEVPTEQAQYLLENYPKNFTLADLPHEDPVLEVMSESDAIKELQSKTKVELITLGGGQDPPVVLKMAMTKAKMIEFLRGE